MSVYIYAYFNVYYYHQINLNATDDFFPPDYLQCDYTSWNQPLHRFPPYVFRLDRLFIFISSDLQSTHEAECQYLVASPARQSHYILARIFVLSILCPSSSCSATSNTGNLAGIIRRGFEPGITLYLEKSVTPHFSRRKSSSVSSSPFTVDA